MSSHNDDEGFESRVKRGRHNMVSWSRWNLAWKNQPTVDSSVPNFTLIDAMGYHGTLGICSFRQFWEYNHLIWSYSLCAADNTFI